MPGDHEHKNQTTGNVNVYFRHEYISKKIRRTRTITLSLQVALTTTALIHAQLNVQ